MMSESDYKKILYTLLPAGQMWPKQEGESPVWDTLISALAQELVRVDDAAEDIILEVIPDADNYLYPDTYLDKWEEIAGLPDSCVFTSQVATVRRQALVAQLRRLGSPIAQKFINIIEPYGFDARVLDGYRLVDSLTRDGSDRVDWTVLATAVLTYESALDPEGGTLADIVELPAASDGLSVDVERIANYEGVYCSIWVKCANGGEAELRIQLIGRDAANKHNETYAFDNQWRRYSFVIDDVGTGGSDPVFKILLESGSNETIHIYGGVGGFRELYHEFFRAGAVAGTPAMGSQANFLFTNEYGDDWTQRSSGNPNWQFSGVGAANTDTEEEPVSRDVLGDDITLTSGYVYCNLDATPPRYIRYSFWAKADSDIDVDFYKRDKTGSYVLVDTLEFTDTWVKYIGVIDMLQGINTCRFRFDAPLGITFYIAHVRMSDYDQELECRVSAGEPLHTRAIFDAYEALGGIENA